MNAIILQNLHRSSKKSNYALQLTKDVTEIIVDDMRLPVSNVTTAFRKLHQQGLVKRTTEAGLRGTRRAVYTLTKKGRQAAIDQLRVIKTLIGREKTKAASDT